MGENRLYGDGEGTGWMRVSDSREGKRLAMLLPVCLTDCPPSSYPHACPWAACAPVRLERWRFSSLGHSPRVFSDGDEPKAEEVPVSSNSVHPSRAGRALSGIRLLSRILPEERSFPAQGKRKSGMGGENL